MNQGANLTVDSNGLLKERLIEISTRRESVRDGEGDGYWLTFDCMYLEWGIDRVMTGMCSMLAAECDGARRHPRDRT